MRKASLTCLLSKDKLRCNQHFLIYKHIDIIELNIRREISLSGRLLWRSITFTGVTTACPIHSRQPRLYHLRHTAPQGQKRENDLDVGTRHRAALFHQFYNLRHRSGSPYITLRFFRGSLCPLMKSQLAELLSKFSYSAHYQLVCTNFGEPLFSLINYAPKGHVLQDEMYGFTVQKVTSHKPCGKHATKEPHYQVVHTQPSDTIKEYLPHTLFVLFPFLHQLQSS